MKTVSIMDSLRALFFGSISLSLFIAVHSLTGAENRTRDGWVGSAKASSVLCRPPNLEAFYWKLGLMNDYLKVWLCWYLKPGPSSSCPPLAISLPTLGIGSEISLFIIGERLYFLSYLFGFTSTAAKHSLKCFRLILIDRPSKLANSSTGSWFQGSGFESRKGLKVIKNTAAYHWWRICNA